MNKTTEALKLAEEALQTPFNHIAYILNSEKALTAIREALAVERSEEALSEQSNTKGESNVERNVVGLTEPVKQEQRKTGGLVGWHLINETGKQNAE